MNSYLFLFLYAILFALPASGQEELTPPTAISNCLQKVGGSFEIRNDLNPFYLRGDFFGTKTPAYAVAIRRSTPLQVGVVICPASGMPIVFMPGEKGKFASKDLIEKHFVAPHWEVYTRAQANDLLKRNHRGEISFGESIVMMWEDGIGLLFYDGRRFRWVPSLQ